MIVSFLTNLFTFNRIQRAKGKIDKAISTFSKAHAGIEKANAILAKSIEQTKQNRDRLRAEISDADRHIMSATLEINGNKSLQNKLKQFIQK